MEAVPPLFCFGVIADIQYADAEDGYDFLGRRRRYYRHSLNLLRAAVEAWATEKPPLAFVLQLGDSIDGLNARSGQSERALEQVLAALGRLPVPVHHAWGNHELYNFSRARLVHTGLNSRSCGAAAGPPASDCQAYHFSPAAQFRVVVLDGYDLSTLGREPGNPRYQESLQLLRKKNPNDNLNDPTGLEEPQFVEFNGGFSQAQLDWFNEVLKFSDENQEKVIVTCPFIQMPQTGFALPGITKMPFRSYTPISVWSAFLQGTCMMVAITIYATSFNAADTPAGN
uniref:Calcineurin-like phosphoesterase domain-containing protein n=1 Tax=Melopsittacus undulatus TaxID=13146 RepID=A0A8C6JNB7_MELUD